MGTVAATGQMHSTFWHVNGKQYDFMERFDAWSMVGFSAKIEEKEHSANGQRVVWGKGVLKASFGFGFGEWAFSLETAETTLSKSYAIPTQTN